MKLARLVLLVALFCFGLGLVGENTCQAQSVFPYGAHGFAYPGWFGQYSNPYAMGRIPTPPYFALHPPVYYSNPVPRTYGYSPYAYPGNVRTPEIEISKPEMIENPHVEELPASGRPAENKTVSWEIIVNPFVTEQARVAAHRP